MASITDFDDQSGSDFRKITGVFLTAPGLPFANILSPQRIQRVFEKHRNWFGVASIYSTAVTLWAFLGQVLRDGKQVPCQAAVAEVTAYCQQQQIDAPSNDAGEYCRARRKLSASALRDISGEVADEVQEQAEETWLWKDHHAKLVDGFTFTMPDTGENQAQ